MAESRCCTGRLVATCGAGTNLTFGKQSTAAAGLARVTDRKPAATADFFKDMIVTPWTMIEMNNQLKETKHRVKHI